MSAADCGAATATKPLWCAGLALVLLAALLGGCGTTSAPTPKLGDGSRLVPGTPPAALATRLAALEPLLLSASSGVAEAQAEIEQHLREIIDLLDDPAFAGHPLPRSELRARVLFVGHGSLESRTAALGRCRELAKSAFPPADGVSSPAPANAAASTEDRPR